MEHRHVEALDDGEVLDALVDQVGKPPEHGAAPTDPEGSPRGGGVEGGTDGALGDGGVPARDVPELHGPVEGGAVLEGGARRHAQSADVVVEGDLDPADLGAPPRAHDSNLGRTFG